MRKKLNVLLAFDSPFEAPADYDFAEELRTEDWKTERDVYAALCDNGFEVRLLGIHNTFFPLLEELHSRPPDVVFNLTEVFRNKARLDKNIVWIIESAGTAYTGASPAALMTCNNKALSKKIMTYHKIRVPNFYTFFRGKKVWLPRRLRPPLIVKPLSDEASRGIARASVVDTEEALVQRVRFIHEQMRSDAIVEEFIEGRELYIGLMGARKVRTLPPIEMKFGKLPEEEPRVATYKAKWDRRYRKRWGIKNTFAANLPENLPKEISDVCKRAYKALDIHSYARFDVRVTSGGEVYILEANANPCLAEDEDFAQAALKAGISYEELIRQIVTRARKIRR